MIHWKNPGIWILILAVMILLMIVGCVKRVDMAEAKEKLLQTDRNFSKLSVEQGTAAAFYHYLDADGLALPKYGDPAGKEEYQQYLARSKDASRKSTLRWEPLLAEVSRSGDLGYTHGRYTLTIIDSVDAERLVYGYYITVWKRQSDGSWKFVLDAGNESPPPEETDRN